MKSRNLLFTAMLLSSGLAFGYDEVTDQTGATEPPRGAADDSFVEGARPGIAETKENRSQESDRNAESRSAQTSPDSRQAQHGDLFERLDQDHDGNVSKYEAKNYNRLVESFNEVDKDNDGVLSSEELNNWEGIDKIDE